MDDASPVTALTALGLALGVAHRVLGLLIGLFAQSLVDALGATGFSLLRLSHWVVPAVAVLLLWLAGRLAPKSPFVLYPGRADLRALVCLYVIGLAASVVASLFDSGGLLNALLVLCVTMAAVPALGLTTHWVT